MSTKINDAHVDRYAALTRSAPTPAGKADNKPAQPVAAVADSLSLTSDALLFQQATNAADEASDIDAARVASVRAELASGNYRVDPQAIATRMMKTEWELYG